MPELPEVETTARWLRKKIVGKVFADVWTDSAKLVKKPESFEKFKKEIKGRKIERIRRRGKNLLFDLSGKKTLLIHLKMTGHMLLGEWRRKNKTWEPPPGPLAEKTNLYIHLLFTFRDGQMMALSDLRRFAKAELWDAEKLENSQTMKSLGPEPLNGNFSFEKFKKALEGKKGEIKKVLMNQEIIAGIGNIYSDEILWRARVHPAKKTFKLSEKELKAVYKDIKKVLKKAVQLKGESFSDYRLPSGRKGFYHKEVKVYRRTGEKCPECGGKIERKKIGGRSAHFCPKCQKL